MYAGREQIEVPPSVEPLSVMHAGEWRSEEMKSNTCSELVVPAKYLVAASKHDYTHYSFFFDFISLRLDRVAMAAFVHVCTLQRRIFDDDDDDNNSNSDQRNIIRKELQTYR